MNKKFISSQRYHEKNRTGSDAFIITYFSASSGFDGGRYEYIWGLRNRQRISWSRIPFCLVSLWRKKPYVNSENKIIKNYAHCLLEQWPQINVCYMLLECPKAVRISCSGRRRRISFVWFLFSVHKRDKCTIVLYSVTVYSWNSSNSGTPFRFVYFSSARAHTLLNAHHIARRDSINCEKSNEPIYRKQKILDPKQQHNKNNNSND